MNHNIWLIIYESFQSFRNTVWQILVLPYYCGVNVLLGGSIGGQCKVRRNKKLYDFLFQTICDKVGCNYVIDYDVILFRAIQFQKINWSGIHGPWLTPNSKHFMKTGLLMSKALCQLKSFWYSMQKMERSHLLGFAINLLPVRKCHMQMSVANLTWEKKLWKELQKRRYLVRIS